VPIPSLLLLALVSSPSLDFVAGALVVDGADGKADGKPVGKFGVCICAYPTIDRKK
jgi:hypothetical protein